MRRLAMAILVIATPVAFADAGCSSADPTQRGESGARENGGATPNPNTPGDPVPEPEDEGELPGEDASTSPDGAGTSDGGATDGGAATDGGTTDVGGPGSGIVQVAIGNHSACRVRVEGTVECWGVNYGDLGVPPTADCSAFGVVGGLDELGFGGPCTPTPTLVPGLTDVVEVAVGRGKCARRRDGTVVCWGLNDGELGISPTDACLPFYEAFPAQRCTKTPTQLAGLTGVVQLAADTGRFCARRGDGTVACWGWNEDGELGVARTGVCAGLPCTTRPTTVAGITEATDLGVGFRHACVVLADGTARCWGANSEGQLGFATSERCTIGSSEPCARKPTQVPGLSALRSIDAGGAHSCALDTSGVLRCWGDNRHGELGDGTRLARHEPRVVSGIGAVADVYAGQGNTCARTADGRAWCWGLSGFEAFGFESPLCTGDEEEYDSCEVAPKLVPSVTGVTDIGLSPSFACFVRTDGTLRCNGDIIGFAFGV